jgi:hypothetical protein
MAQIGKSSTERSKRNYEPKIPKPWGQRVTISAFVDANHARNKVTRLSHTGNIIYVQNAPNLWYSKRQNTVEAATFGSEMVALQIHKELIVAIRYKLRMSAEWYLFGGCKVLVVTTILGLVYCCFLCFS